MSDLISRQEAIDYFVTNIGVVDEDGFSVDDYDELMKVWTERFSGIPSAEPERKTGKWVDRAVYYLAKCEYQTAKCSVCGMYLTTPYMYYFDEYRFCPNCGADMRGE